MASFPCCPLNLVNHALLHPLQVFLSWPSLKKKSEKKNKSHLSPSDTDSDFESPKKREKKETSTQESSQTPSSGTRDHTYAKDAANTAESESVSQSAIPDVAEKILPSGYAYQCHEFKEHPTDSFTGAPQNSF